MTKTILIPSAQAILCLLFLVTPSLAEKRIALVIGNASYQYAGPLKNPANDANDVAQKLAVLGFEVIRAIDLDTDGFDEVFNRFSKRLQDADIALLFYAGHGIQYKGKNFLLPTDAKLKNRFSIRRETFSLSDFTHLMEQKSKLNLVFLDACRNNPLAQRLNRSRSSSRSVPLLQGLRRIDQINSEMLIVYATAPDAVAADGRGRNSPFTSALLHHMEAPNIEVEVMLKRVTRTVRTQTGEQQKPERLSQLTTEFYFNRQMQKRPSTQAAKINEEIHRLQSRLREEQQKQLVSLASPSPKLKFKAPQTIWLPGGQTRMGCFNKKSCRSDELPVHTVTLKPFHMATHETSFAQWDSCVDEGGCRMIRDDEGWGRSKRPVINVSWYDARAYARWLSRKTGQSWRLPTEAEWEYAARAQFEKRFTFGNKLTPKQANFGDLLGRTNEVGKFSPNRFGLFDMHGNVAEWVSDRYGKNYYSHSQTNNPKGPKQGIKRINRGGGWHYGAKFSRSAMRFPQHPAKRLSNVGFRLVREF